MIEQRIAHAHRVKQMSEEAAQVAEADGRDFVTQEDVEQAAAPQARMVARNTIPEDLAKAYKELESNLALKKKTFATAL